MMHQFFPAENVDTLIESIRAAFYKRGVPHALYVGNGSIYSLLTHDPKRMITPVVNRTLHT